MLRFSDGSYLEDQDHWWLSGIYRCARESLRYCSIKCMHGSAIKLYMTIRLLAPCRDVFLLSKPATHISDFVVRTPLTFNKRRTSCRQPGAHWPCSGPKQPLGAIVMCQSLNHAHVLHEQSVPSLHSSCWHG